MSVACGTRLGPYEIVAPLGAGGMGEVYRARDARLGRDVAVKVLPSHLALDRTALARFEREARAVAALSHPNILSIFDVGQEGGVAYAVTELLEGETLRDRLRGGPLPLRKALEYAAQVADGLAAAHAKGIVHRDLKPENVFLTPDGRAKLLDFGLAKSAGGDAPRAPGDAYDATLVVATEAGQVAGTPPYMAPEQVRGQVVTAQTDIFAFGSVLFEMLTGRRAFQRQSPVETMTAVLREEPPAVTAIDPTIPPAVAAVVRHCLEKQPGERFQSAHDVAFQLRVLPGMTGEMPITTGETPITAGGTPITAGGTPIPRRQVWRRAPAWGRAAALLVLLLAALAAGWWMAHRPVGAPQFTRISYTPKVVYRAAFAPGNDVVLFSAATDGNRPQLFQVGAQYPSSHPVGLPPDTHLLSVSSTGELALLVNARVVTANILRGTLARMPLGGDAPRPLLEDVRDADWAGGDGEMAIVRGAGEKDRLECPPGKILYETDGYLSDLHASPDGSRFAMFEHDMKWEAPASLVVVDRGGRKTTLGGPYGYARGVAWRPDGGEVVFSASVHGAGNASIFAVPGAGGSPRVVLQAPGSLTVHDVSAAGKWLVSRDDRRMGIRGLAPGETAERDLSWLDQSELTALTDDGRKVLFTELAPPAGEEGAVCVRDTGGGAVVSLGPGVAHDLSPDGAWALALADSPPRLQLYPTGTGDKRTLPAGLIQNYRWASWFPDGRRVLACGEARGEASRCYAQPADGSAPPVAVTPDGMWGVVSPDGKRVLTWRPESEPVIYPLERPSKADRPAAEGIGFAAGVAEKIAGVTVEDLPVRWTADGRGVFVYRPRLVPGQIDRVELATGRREVVRQFSPPDRVGILSIDPVLMSADGSSYAYTYSRVLSTLFLVTQ